MEDFKSIFNRACKHVEKSYIDRDFIDNKWIGIRTHYKQLIADVKDKKVFYKIMSKLINEELPLSHTDFLSPENCEKIDAITSCENVPEYLQLNHHKTNDYLYIKIPTLLIPVFSIYPVAKLFSEEEVGNRIIVLDFRLNTGGSASAVGQLLSFFIEPNSPYLTSKLADYTDFAAPKIIYPQPEEHNGGNCLDVEICQKYSYSEWHTPIERLGNLDNEVLLLIDDKNYSCGEVFAQAMKEYNRCKLIGQTSNGAVVGASDDYDCGSGYRLMLPFVTMESAQGYIIEGKGVDPDIKHAFDRSPFEPMQHSEIEEILNMSII